MRTSLFRYFCLLALLLVLTTTGRASAADWAANYASLVGANATVYAIARDASGNVYLAGWFDGATFTLGSVTLTKIGGPDSFIAKLDQSGTVLWAKNFGGSGASVSGSGIAVDGSGNVYLCGRFSLANLTTPALTLIGIGGNDAFVLKLSSTGATIWAKNFGGGGVNTYGTGIAVDGSSNVYLGGYFQNSSLTTPVLPKIGNSDAFALKLSSTGTTIWAKSFGGSGAYAQSNGIAVDGSGNVYLAGHLATANLTTPALTKIGSQDAFAIKLDSAGTATWAKNFGGSGASASLISIAVDAGGNAYLGGRFLNANLTTPALTKIGTLDSFAIKLDATGTTAWAKNFGGSGANAYLTGIAVDDSGNTYLCGLFNAANLTTPVVTKIGSRDAFAIKLDATGVTAWAKNFGGSGAAAEGNDITVGSSGNVYLGGIFYSANLTTPALTKIGTQDAFIIFTQLYDLTFAAGLNGSVNGTTLQTVSSGVNATAVTAVPNANYHFVNWTGTNGFVTTTANPMIITNATANMSITANFDVTDITPPTITITSAPMASSNQVSGVFAFTANEAATFECKVDSGAYAACTSPFSYSNLPNAHHTVAIKATDSSGNTSTSTHTWTINTALAGYPGSPGWIMTVAGNGDAFGENVIDTIASRFLPLGVTVDSSGNLFVADNGNNRILKVASGTGIITTVAGNGVQGFSGDGGAATSASLNFPTSVAVDSAGNLFIADSQNSRIRKVAAATGIITTVAGNGTGSMSIDGPVSLNGDNGAATDASLSPGFVAIDNSGNLFIAERMSSRIRKVDAMTGIITAVAGNSVQGFSGDNGAATSASLSFPHGVAVDSTGNLFIADSGNNRIRKVAAGTGIITTVAGNGIAGFNGDNGVASSASLYNPYGITVDNSDNLFVADFNNYRVRKVSTTTGIITTVAGDGGTGVQGFSGVGGTAISTSIGITLAVAVDSSGNLFIGTGGVIRKVDVGTGIISTIITGNDTASGIATATNLSGPNGGPMGVTTDSNGNLFIADRNNRIRKVDVFGIITTVAGNGEGGFSGDNGVANAANLNNPFGVTVDRFGNLFIADTYNNRIRRVDAVTRVITTLAGNGTASFSGDNGAAIDASLNRPFSVTVDNSGNLFIADWLNSRIRKVDAATGVITTVAGNGIQGFSGDNGAATAASISSPQGVAVDSTGNLFITDSGRIRKVSAATGIITSVYGDGTGIFSGDNGAATSAGLSGVGITFDNSGNLFIADLGNFRIRKIDITGIITTVAGNGIMGFSGDNGAATSASLYFPTGVAVDSTGNLSIADGGSNRIRKVFLSPLAPAVSTGVASSFLATGATLHGTVNDNGAITTVAFEYGATTGYGTSTNAGTVGIGAGASAVNATVSGLACNSTYHFRVVGTNSVGTSNGGDATFTTSACLAGNTPAYTWSATSGTNNTIYRTSPDGTQVLLANLPAAQTSYSDNSALLFNTIYTYCVKADDIGACLQPYTIHTPLYNGWNIVGVPYDTTGIAAATVFNSPVSAVYEWIPTSNVNPDNSGTYTPVATLTPGKGYFVKAGNSNTLMAYSGAVNPAGVNVVLKPGYTLVSNTQTTNMTNIGTNWLIDGVPLATYINAIPPKIGGAVYWWNGINYDSWNILDLIPAMQPTIEPWKAYWLLNLDTINHTLTIQ